MKWNKREDNSEIGGNQEAVQPAVYSQLEIIDAVYYFKKCNSKVNYTMFSRIAIDTASVPE